MDYKEMMKKHQDEYDVFANGKIFYIFAFNEDDFKKQLAENGVTQEEEISHIFGGAYIKKIYKQDLIDMFHRQKKEKQNAINADKDGTGFIKSMFLYELCNHEYAYTYDTEEALKCLGFTVDDINDNPALKNGLDLAIKDIVGDTEE